ncbi:MAG: hypothetical protein ACLGG0_05715 [Bacteriovoracia bacterium]
MKKLMIIAALALTSSAYAATVKVTSYVYLRSGEPQAELCGLVEDAETTPSFIRVQVDHRTNRPATYNTVAGADGRFCISVVTYRGTAEVRLFDAESGTEAILK